MTIDVDETTVDDDDDDDDDGSGCRRGRRRRRSGARPAGSRVTARGDDPGARIEDARGDETVEVVHFDDDVRRRVVGAGETGGEGERVGGW